jgi:hypothetical protein
MTAVERCDRLDPEPLGDGHEARTDATQIVVRVRLPQLGDALPIRQSESLDSQLAARH